MVIVWQNIRLRRANVNDDENHEGLEIVFEEGRKYLYEGERVTGTVHTGQWFTYRVLVKNLRSEAYQWVALTLLDIQDGNGNVPDGMGGQLPFKLPFSHSANQDTEMHLSPHGKETVDVFSFHRKLYCPYIHIGGQRGPQINGVSTYTITLQAESDSARSEPKQFEIGLSGPQDCSYTLFMRIAE